MKLTIEVTLSRTEGPTCTSEMLFEELESELLMELWVQNPDKDQETCYQVTEVDLVLPHKEKA